MSATRRKVKTQGCGHKGMGKFCHRCDQADAYATMHEGYVKLRDQLIAKRDALSESFASMKPGSPAHDLCEQQINDLARRIAQTADRVRMTSPEAVARLRFVGHADKQPTPIDAPGALKGAEATSAEKRDAAILASFRSAL